MRTVTGLIKSSTHNLPTSQHLYNMALKQAKVREDDITRIVRVVFYFLTLAQMLKILVCGCECACGHTYIIVILQ